MDPPAVARGGEADEPAALPRFRRLVSLTIVATFVLILIGGVVRVSDSGLGCGAAGSGTQGWPLCEGGLLPAGSAESVIEFTHRAAAGVVGLMIGLLVLMAVRRLRAHRWIVRGSIAAGALVLAQAGLGGLTVEEGLHEALVAAHLGLAMVMLGLLILLRRAADPVAVAPPAPRVRGLVPATLVASTLLLATIVAGGYVAGTEKEGTAAEPAVGQAHVACGEEFPGCNGSVMPFGQSRLTDIQLTHRLFMYLTTIALLVTAAIALRGGASRAFGAAILLLAGQVLLGAANVWAGKHAGLILGHLALATALWGTVVYAGATLLPASAPAIDEIGGREAAGAVTA
jgi:heme A synthase